MTVNECVVGETGHFLVVGEVSGWEDAALPTGTFFFFCMCLCLPIYFFPLVRSILFAYYLSLPVLLIS